MTAPKYKVGDVCITLIGSYDGHFSSGTIFTITKIRLGFSRRKGMNVIKYLTDVQKPGCRFCYTIIEPYFKLYKEPPAVKKQKTVSWDSVGWSPHKLTHPAANSKIPA